MVNKTEYTCVLRKTHDRLSPKRNDKIRWTITQSNFHSLVQSIPRIHIKISPVKVCERFGLQATG